MSLLIVRPNFLKYSIQDVKKAVKQNSFKLPPL
jgi:hypothetical protein